MEFRYRAGDKRDTSLAPRSSGGVSRGVGGAISRSAASEATREMKKQRIREEIITGEWEERRILELEVFREMAMERAIELRTGSLPLPALRLPAPDVCDERLSGVSGGDGVLIESDTVQQRYFSKSPVEPLITDAEKNLSGAESHGIKIKAKAGAGESRKLAQTEQCWRCDLCHKSLSSEQNLKEHMMGKKHKRKLDDVVVESEGATVIPISMVKAVSASVKDKSTVHEPKVPKIKVDGKMHQMIPNKTESGSVEAKSTVQGPKMVNIKIGGQMHQVVQVENYLWCQLCSAMCSCMRVMCSHLSGKKHRDKVVKSSSSTKLSNTTVANLRRANEHAADGNRGEV